MLKRLLLNCKYSLWILLISMFATSAGLSQKSLLPPPTSEITVQGKLTDTGNNANGNYDFQVCLCVNPGCTAPIVCQERTNVQVIDSIYNFTLDYGTTVWDGTNRYLQIAVRLSGNQQYVVLTPTQPITSNPYSIRSSASNEADGLSSSCDSTDCVKDQYIETVSGSKITGLIPVGSLPTDSISYIQNSSNQQPGSNFNISDTGKANIFDAATQYNIGGNRVLSLGTAIGNTFVGLNTGTLTTGSFNSFFGKSAGTANTAGNGNSFFGVSAGENNTTGSGNAFFGGDAGNRNDTGDDNSFFGTSAGFFNAIGINNSFFGRSAGFNNTTGSSNSFFGASAGFNNTTSNNNSFFGVNAGSANTTGSSNSFFGAASGKENITGGFNTFVGFQSGMSSTSVSHNSFFGNAAGKANTTGFNNSYFGSTAGESNVGGNNNAFFGYLSGRLNVGGSSNSFFGSGSGSMNTNGSRNSFFGLNSGVRNTTGNENVFVGYNNGQNNTSGNNNTFVGFDAGSSNQTGSNNTILGANASFGGATPTNLTFATAIGAGAVVSTSNSIVLGRSGGAQDTVRIPGRLNLQTLAPAGATDLCLNASLEVGSCASSIRYKSNVKDFRSGIDLIKRLRPVSFNWTDGGMPDFGLVAEEVETVEPLLTTQNQNGQVEGVKYDRVGVVLINAVNEQQKQIETQQKQITQQNEIIKSQQQKLDLQAKELEALKRLVCMQNPSAVICKPKP